MPQGAVLQFQGGGALNNRFFLLAAAMKKPFLQVMLECFRKTDMLGDGVYLSILDPASRKPVFFTSHQVFQSNISDDVMVTILQDGIGFVVHEYSVNSLAPLTFVKLTSCSQVNYLVATKAKPQKCKPSYPSA